MNRPSWHIWRVFLSLLAASLILISASCKKHELTTATGVLDKRLPDESSTNVRVTELDGDRIDYDLMARRIDRYYDTRILNAIGVQIKSYNPDTGATSYLSADSTIVDDARNMIFAYGNVHLSSPGGAVSSQSMIWDRNADEIIAPGKVTVTRAGSTLRGERLRTNPNIDFAELDIVSADGTLDATDFDW